MRLEFQDCADRMIGVLHGAMEKIRLQLLGVFEGGLPI